MMTKKQLEQRLKDVEECMTPIRNEIFSLMNDFATVAKEIVDIKTQLRKLEGDDLK